jgi:hypothetical protein
VKELVTVVVKEFEKSGKHSCELQFLFLPFEDLFQSLVMMNSADQREGEIDD